jgi:hypothetical protein
MRSAVCTRGGAKWQLQLARARGSIWRILRRAHCVKLYCIEMTTRTALLILTAVLSTTPPVQIAPNAPAPPALEDVLTRAAWYVVRFEREIPSVVAEERYRQRLVMHGQQQPSFGGRSPRPDDQRRELKSDFLMVRSQETDHWIPFRDVFEVDGKPVRAREERLTKLLVDASGSAYDRAMRLSEESARYNIGPVQRTVNVPTQALQFLLPANQPKCAFKQSGVDRVEGLSVWEVRFEEVGLPTLIRTSGGASLPASGTFCRARRAPGVPRGDRRQVRTASGTGRSRAGRAEGEVHREGVRARRDRHLQPLQEIPRDDGRGR